MLLWGNWQLLEFAGIQIVTISEVCNVGSDAVSLIVELIEIYIPIVYIMSVLTPILSSV
jgi:hypothetical protein